MCTLVLVIVVFCLKITMCSGDYCRTYYVIDIKKYDNYISTKF